MCLFSCSKDDGPSQASLEASSIAIIKADGTPLDPSSCIDPNERYAVAIKTILNGDGEIQTKRVEYTVNGNLFSMTFTQATTQNNPITLATGTTTVQLVESGTSDTITLIAPSEFVIVE